MLLQSNVHSPQRTAPNFDKVRRMIAVCHGKKAATLQRAEMMLPCPPCMELPFEGSFVCNQGSLVQELLHWRILALHSLFLCLCFAASIVAQSIVHSPPCLCNGACSAAEMQNKSANHAAEAEPTQETD